MINPSSYFFLLKYFNDTIRTYLGAHAAGNAGFRAGVHHIAVSLFIDSFPYFQDLSGAYVYA